MAGLLPRMTGGSVRSRLQYIYSISVFVGVLITGYSFVQEDQDKRHSRSISGSYTRDESTDSYLSQMIEVSRELSRLTNKNQTPFKPNPQ